MIYAQLRALLTTMADHPSLRGNDIRVFIHIEGQLSWREPSELKLDGIAPKRRGGRRLSRGAVSNAVKRLERAGFVIAEDRQGWRGRTRYRLPKPPRQLLMAEDAEMSTNETDNVS